MRGAAERFYMVRKDHSNARRAMRGVAERFYMVRKDHSNARSFLYRAPSWLFQRGAATGGVLRICALR